MRASLRQKFQIATQIEQAATEIGGVLTYAPGWSDARIARENGVSADLVRGVRKNILPEMRGAQTGGGHSPPAGFNDFKESTGARLDLLEARIEALERKNYSPRTAA